MSAARAPRAREVATASVPGRICLAGESLDWMTGGNSVTAAVPLRTRARVHVEEFTRATVTSRF